MTISNHFQVVVPAADFRSRPKTDSGLETQCLFGEKVTLVEEHGSFLKVRSDFYSTPGYVRRKDLRQGYVTPTHRISKPVVPVRMRPEFKSPARTYLAMNSLVKVIGGQDTPEGNMVQIDELGWCYSDQVLILGTHRDNYVAVMQEFIGMPYGWGEVFYPDCSALLMQALRVCGIRCPRNVGEQVVHLGQEFSFTPDFSNLQKGYLVFWTDPSTKGRHVVVMTSRKDCVHATIAKPYRGTLEQPLAQVIADQEREGNGRPTVVRHFPMYRF